MLNSGYFKIPKYLLAHGFNLHQELMSSEVPELHKVIPLLCKHKILLFVHTGLHCFSCKKPTTPKQSSEPPHLGFFHSCHPDKKPHLSFREMSMPCYMLLCNYRSKSIAAECHLLRAAEQHQKCEQCIFPY